MRLLAVFAAMLCLQWLTGCTRRYTYEPDVIPIGKSGFSSQTIALAPVVAPSGISVAESVLVQIDTHIEGVLLRAGYRCISTRDYVDTWNHIISQMDGLYDRRTGDLDDLKLEVAREQLLRDLQDDYHADQVLHPEIWIVDAEHSGGVAKWDGTSQSIVGIGTQMLNLIDAILGQYDGFLEPGVVSALSLGVVVEDMKGVEKFHNVAGIEVLKDLDSDDAFATVALDKTRSQRAVELALMPLLERAEVFSPQH